MMPRATEQVRCLLGGVAMARAVRAVAADAVLLVVLAWQRIEVCLRRHGGMERRVEDGHLRRVRHVLAQHVDAGVGRRVVQRRQLLAQRELLARLVVDDGRLREVLAARHDAVADGVDLVEVADRRLDVISHHFEQLLQTLGNGLARHVVAHLLELGCERHVHACAFGAHFLGDALHERHLAVGFDELALKRRAAGVYDQYEHEVPP